jgi:hypothetical protein
MRRSLFALLLGSSLAACGPDAPHCEGAQIKECYRAPDDPHSTCSERVLEDCGERDLVCVEDSYGPKCVPRDAEGSAGGG